MSTQNNNTQEVNQDDKTEKTNKMIYIYQNLFVSSKQKIDNNINTINYSNNGLPFTLNFPHEIHYKDQINEQPAREFFAQGDA